MSIINICTSKRGRGWMQGGQLGVCCDELFVFSILLGEANMPCGWKENARVCRNVLLHPSERSPSICALSRPHQLRTASIGATGCCCRFCFRQLPFRRNKSSSVATLMSRFALRGKYSWCSRLPLLHGFGRFWLTASTPYALVLTGLASWRILLFVSRWHTLWVANSHAHRDQRAVMGHLDKRHLMHIRLFAFLRVARAVRCYVVTQVHQW